MRRDPAHRGARRAPREEKMHPHRPQGSRDALKRQTSVPQPAPRAGDGPVRAERVRHPEAQEPGRDARGARRARREARQAPQAGSRQVVGAAGDARADRGARLDQPRAHRRGGQGTGEGEGVQEARGEEGGGDDVVDLFDANAYYHHRACQSSRTLSPTSLSHYVRFTTGGTCLWCSPASRTRA